MIYIKSAQQIEAMSVAGAKLWDVLQQVKQAVRPGITTASLDKLAERLIRQHGAVPSFLNYRSYRGGPYPASLCTSVDDQIVHGIPSEGTVLTEGQIIGLDCGLIYDGWHADSALTVGVGKISDTSQRLIRVAEECFWLGAAQAIAGNHLGDVAHAVQSHAEANGCGVIRRLSGHGIGRALHEDPEVCNFGEPGQKAKLRSGMTFALEPMICLGSWEVCELDNGWTYTTDDGSFSAHYEHTIAVTDKGLPRILTLPGFVWGEAGR